MTASPRMNEPAESAVAAVTRFPRSLDPGQPVPAVVPAAPRAGPTHAGCDVDCVCYNRSYCLESYVPFNLFGPFKKGIAPPLSWIAHATHLLSPYR